MSKTMLLATFAFVVAWTSPSYAESQGQDYRGVQDPFGDPTNYEFTEDEREDKEFFHLGRYVMLAVDLGAGVLTGGLGASTGPGFFVGGRLVYFLDRQLAMEIGGHYSNHLDSVVVSTTRRLDLDTNIISLGGGFRFYFETKNAPRAMAIANPFLVIGADMIMRNQVVVNSQGTITAPPNPDSSAFGGNIGGGAEFLIYRRHVYLGVDLRYHLIFWPDKDDTLGGAVAAGSRDGGYVTTAATLTYNF